MKQLLIALLAILVLVLGSFSLVHAGLFSRGVDDSGVQLIYDSDLNITWYDFSRPGSSQFLVNSWEEQLTWVSNLSVNFGGKVYNDWRLPSALNPDGTGPCSGYNCTQSELGHLYYVELGHHAFDNFIDNGVFDYLWSGPYFSGTEDQGLVWIFHTADGSQSVQSQYGAYYAIAVREGDVGNQATVPIPSSILLLLSGGSLLLTPLRWIGRMNKAL